MAIFSILEICYYYKASNSIKLYILQIFCITHLILNLMEKETEVEAEKKKQNQNKINIAKINVNTSFFYPFFFCFILATQETLTECISLSRSTYKCK